MTELVKLKHDLNLISLQLDDCREELQILLIGKQSTEKEQLRKLLMENLNSLAGTMVFLADVLESAVNARSEKELQNLIDEFYPFSGEQIEEKIN